MPESAKQTKKIDLEYYAIHQHWFRVAFIIMCNLQNIIRRSCLQRHLSTLSLIINKKKKKRKKEKIDSKQFCKHLLGILGGFP